MGPSAGMWVPSESKRGKGQNCPWREIGLENLGAISGDNSSDLRLIIWACPQVITGRPLRLRSDQNRRWSNADLQHRRLADTINAECAKRTAPLAGRPNEHATVRMRVKKITKLRSEARYRRAE